MNISLEEAFSLLGRWRDGNVSLRVRLSNRRSPMDAQVRGIAGTVISLVSGAEELRVDLQGAEFNGDARAENSNHGPYLICEFRNGDRHSFYVRST